MLFCVYLHFNVLRVSEFSPVHLSLLNTALNVLLLFEISADHTSSLTFPQSPIPSFALATKIPKTRSECILSSGSSLKVINTFTHVISWLSLEEEQW